ncbi:hypothetical protein [Anaerovorax sp. IOR16]|uniref:hypothetical protein n=1 Tax=Anaerovorax sp. IOR16 TaxID=2773458 RepID=UPI0019D1EC12|nr:hypothetical protein [Anaerovorax sp. IOR16]
MSENKCPFHPDHENRIKKLEKDVEDLDNQFTKLDKSTAVKQEKIFTILEALSKIPETMESMKNTMVEMQREIRDSSTKMDALERNVDSLKNQVTDTREKIDKVDDEGKFNIRLWIKNKWFWLSLGLATLLYYSSEITQHGLK